MCLTGDFSGDARRALRQDGQGERERERERESERERERRKGGHRREVGEADIKGCMREEGQER